MRSKRSAKFWTAGSCLVASLLFMLFQGGKVSSMIFIIISFLCLYIWLGRFSGIKSTDGTRRLIHSAGMDAVPNGTQLQVQVNVHVPGVWPIPYLLISDQLYRKQGSKLDFESAIVLDWKRRGHMIYSTPPLRRGHYYFGETICATEDIFGLFSHQESLSLQASFRVLPETVTIKEWKRLDQIIKGHLQHTATTQALRETTQINGVREYIYGDRLSRIHWNATAKTGTWKSKEFEREARPKTMIVLDRNKDSYASEAAFELAVSTAASLMEYGVQKELSLGLISVGKDAVVIEPRPSKSMHHAMKEHLIGVEADGSLDLMRIVKERLKQHYTGCFVVIISPLHQEKQLDVLRFLSQRQMTPCHIHIVQQTENKDEIWIERVRKMGFHGYSIKELAELPAVLGGVNH